MSGIINSTGSKSGVIGETELDGKVTLKAFCRFPSDSPGSGDIGESMNVASISVSDANVTLNFIKPIVSPRGSFSIYKWSTGNYHFMITSENNATGLQSSITFFTRKLTEGSTSIVTGNFSNAMPYVYGGGE